MVYGSPDVTTKYAYDGDQVIEEYDVNNTRLRRYFYGPNIDEPLAMIDHTGGNKLYYYHFDPLGSVVALSDVNGILVERYDYDVFGKPTILAPNNELRTISSYGNPYMFTGRRYDTETGLYYYRARYYSYEIGRFLQLDPIRQINLKEPVSKVQKVSLLLLMSSQQQFNPWLAGTAPLNLYTYAQNNPSNNTDPTGLLCCDWAGLAFCFGQKYQMALGSGPQIAGCITFCVGCAASHFTAFWACLGCAGCVGGAVLHVADCLINNCE